MDIEAYRSYCLAKAGVTEEFPFDNNTLVFKVLGKMFALCDVDGFESVNLKCDPEEAVLLREKFDFVLPGYHMSKKHWNTVIVALASDQQLKEWIDSSYELVVSGLSKKLRVTLNPPNNE